LTLVTDSFLQFRETLCLNLTLATPVDVHRKFGKVWPRGFEDMRAIIQKDTHSTEDGQLSLERYSTLSHEMRIKAK